MIVKGESIYGFEKTDKNGVYLVSFSAKADVCTPLKVAVTLDNGEKNYMDYFVPVQKTRFGMMFDEGVPEKITFATVGEILVSDITLESRESLDKACFETGMFLEEPFEKATLGEKDGIGDGCADIVTHGNLLFAIGSGRLTSYDISDMENLHKISRIEVGEPLRQIAICGDGKNVIVTCRQNGMYIIDVQNPENMKIRTKYDTIEFATGIVVEDGYAFVSCRQYGVEIIDISDPDKPRHVSIARCGEAQSCKVHNGILYAGVWGGLCVDIIDVKNPAKPKKLSKASLNGKGDGLSVHTFDGKTYLYAATGQHSLNLPLSTKASEPRYGQGNGLDIFDVTDPRNPTWLSTNKIDGRFYNYANDYWETEISKTPDGKIYAYVVNTHNGVFVFDVTDPKRVKRLCCIDIRITKDSEKFRTWNHPTRPIMFPYNQNEHMNDAIGAVICRDGYMMIAGVYTGLHIYKNESFVYENLEVKSSKLCEEGSFYDSMPREVFARYRNGGQLYAVCSWNNKLFAACGQKGIACLDSCGLKEEYRVPVKDVCFDAAVYENTLYTAEGMDGLGIYAVNNCVLTEIGRYKSGNGSVKSVRLSPKAKYALLQCGAVVCEVVRLCDMKCICIVATRGIMYHKNLCNSLVDRRYMGVYGNSSETYWFDFGKDGELDTPVLLRNGEQSMTFQSSVISMSGGHESFKNKALAVMGHGKYLMYEPNNPCVSFDEMNKLKVYQANTHFDGKPVIRGDTFVATDRIEGRIHIGNISGDGQVTIDKTLCVNSNPDVALVKDNSLYVPLGYEGLIRISL